MTSSFRTRMMTGCALVAVLLFPVMAPAGEAVATDVAVSAIPETGDTAAMTLGGVLGPPETVRFWHYMDGDAESWCADLPAGTSVLLFSETFVTNPTTTYIEVNLTGEYGVRSGRTVLQGVYFQVLLSQAGVGTSYFPGAGDEIPTLMSRRDDSANGQQIFSGYHGIISAMPSRLTRIQVKVYADQKDGLACYQNLSVRYD